MIECFEPLIDNESKLLILGSIPGIKSLEQAKYYAHPRNNFWKILYTLFEEPYGADYEKKKNFLRRHHIAVWDVIKHCKREGSLDTAIKDDETNDFDWLFKTYPNIHTVLFNGTKAYQTFNKKVGFAYKDISFHKLGSTSPAHAIAFEDRIKDWEIIRRLMN